VAAEPASDVPQPVAQSPGFGYGEVAVRQQGLRPADQVEGEQDQLEPDGVAPPPVKRQVASAGRLGAADAVLYPGMLAVARSSRAMSGSGWSVMKTWKR
jgi:hypothetical protein